MKRHEERRDLGHVEDAGANGQTPVRADDWKLWPPSPKMQIILIAAGFGIFNFILLAIWAWVMVNQF